MLAELDELAQALAERVNRAVAIDDPTLRLLVHTPHHGAVDQTRMQSIMHLRADTDMVSWVLGVLRQRNEEVFRLPSQPSRGLMSRVCAPLRSEGRTLGYLWLIDEDETLTEAQLADIAEAARAGSRIMAQGGMPRDTLLVWERSLTADLFLPDSAVRAVAARSLVSLCDIAGRVQCAVFGVPGHGTAPADEGDMYRALRRAVAMHTDARCLTLVEQRIGTLIVPVVESWHVIDDIVTSARKELAGRGAPNIVKSAKGDVVEGLEQVNDSHRQALATLQVVERSGEFGVHANWSDIGAYRLFVQLDVQETLDDLLPDALASLISEPAAVDILKTVEVYLDHAADVQGSIAVLNIHRTSLYYRLRRFADASGMDLRDGQARLTVHAALKLARLGGWRPGEPLVRPPS